jgi:hypothetical protein
MSIYNPFKSQDKKEAEQKSSITQFAENNSVLITVGGTGLVTVLTATTLPAILLGWGVAEVGIALHKRQNKRKK